MVAPLRSGESSSIRAGGRGDCRPRVRSSVGSGGSPVGTPSVSSSFHAVSGCRRRGTETPSAPARPAWRRTAGEVGVPSDRFPPHAALAHESLGVDALLDDHRDNVCQSRTM